LSDAKIRKIIEKYKCPAIQEEKKRVPSNGSFNKTATVPPNCPKNRQSNKITTEVNYIRFVKNRD